MHRELHYELHRTNLLTTSVPVKAGADRSFRHESSMLSCVLPLGRKQDMQVLIQRRLNIIIHACRVL